MAELNRNTPHHQERGWGYELWYANSPEYCGKLLYVAPNKCGSLHFHLNKHETMLVIEGRMTLKLIDPSDGRKYSRIIIEGESIVIPRGQVHQICAGPIGCKIIEFSTKHEEDDSYRVEKGD